MGHTPYGYRIENGIAVVIETEAQCIRNIFNNYLSGMSLSESAKAAGHPLVHSTVKRMLTRSCYCGDDFYPPIVDEVTFQKAGVELKRRAVDMNRTGKTRRTVPQAQTDFTIAPPQQHFEDPYKQAEYLYTLIESKVTICQK